MLCTQTMFTSESGFLPAFMFPGLLPLAYTHTQNAYMHDIRMCARIQYAHTHSMPSQHALTTFTRTTCTHNMRTPTCTHNMQNGTDLRVRWLEGKIHGLDAFGIGMLCSRQIQGNCRLHARGNSLAARTNPVADIPRSRLLVI